MTTKTTLDALKQALSALDYYTPYLQVIPGVQEPDCTKLFQSKIDIAAEIKKMEVP